VIRFDATLFFNRSASFANTAVPPGMARTR
jgi:hypothetical protein